VPLFFKKGLKMIFPPYPTPITARMDYCFNDFIGPETLQREYKEFSFHKTGVPFELAEVERYCETRQFEFNELVKMNIVKYIDQYVPKYVSGFWNAGLDGEMYIGTDDYGCVKGIPLSSDTTLDPESLYNYMSDVIQTHVREKDGKPFETNIQLDIMSVDMPEAKDECHPLYRFYDEQKREFLASYQSFVTEYKAWQHTYEMVNMKLVDIVNNLPFRNALIEYVESSPKRNEAVLQILYDNEYRLPALTGEDIKDIKHDTSNIFYWVTNFKDDLSVNYKKDKPTFTLRFKHRYIPYNLLMCTSDMIPYWKNIKLYLIRIHCKKQEPNVEFVYRNDSQWVYSRRIMDPFTKQPAATFEKSGVKND
jgi:hypothetical protein